MMTAGTWPSDSPRPAGSSMWLRRARPLGTDSQRPLSKASKRVAPRSQSRASKQFLRLPIRRRRSARPTPASTSHGFEPCSASSRPRGTRRSRPNSIGWRPATAGHSQCMTRNKRPLKKPMTRSPLLTERYAVLVRKLLNHRPHSIRRMTGYGTWTDLRHEAECSDHRHRGRCGKPPHS